VRHWYDGWWVEIVLISVAMLAVLGLIYLAVAGDFSDVPDVWAD
jgi:hypothetical protein